MAHIRLHDVAFAHADAASPLFSSLTLELPSGWTALLGPNGAGKTTLLQLITGRRSPTRGVVRLEPSGGLVVLVAQTVDDPGERVEALGRSWDKRAARLQARWGLDPEALSRWPTLSPGERKRWQIAAAVHAEPDVLLLDEPTHHLDAEARAGLVARLARFRGAGVVVSHDRAFVDSLATRTVWLERGAAEVRAGGYEAAREARRSERASSQHRRQVARAEEKRLASELDRRRRQHVAAGRSISARARMKSAQDSDGREVGRKTRATKAEAKLAQAQRRMERRVQGAAGDVQRAHVVADHRTEWALGSSLAPKSVVLRASLGGLSVGARELAPGSDLVLARDQRVRLTGPNGSGKSTVMRALVDRWRAPPERLLYLPQELDAAGRRRTLSDLLALPPDERGRALTLVAALGVDPKALLQTKEPSPGEARKLLFARGLAREAWCLMLDEPTHHLDAPAIERLERALAEFPGAIVVATHDAALAERLELEDWSVPERWAPVR